MTLLGYLEISQRVEVLNQRVDVIGKFADSRTLEIFLLLLYMKRESQDGNNLIVDVHFR